MKFATAGAGGCQRRRPLCGGRGLKLREELAGFRQGESSPLRGTWIEIVDGTDPSDGSASSPLRGTWIEISRDMTTTFNFESSPLRGTWIEMVTYLLCKGSGEVVPFAGDVDRNNSWDEGADTTAVIPFAGYIV